MVRISEESSVTFVELPATEYGRLDGQLNVSVYSRFRSPSRSIHVLEGIVRHAGWRNVQSINPLYHGRDGKLTEENKERIFNSDVLCVSSITLTSPQSMELIRQYKSGNPDGVVIAGGMDPTYRTEEWLKAGADIVVLKEADRTIVELLDRLKEGYEPGKDSLDYVKGIAYNREGVTQITEERKLLTEKELSELPLPYYDEITRAKVNVAVFETSRGCPWGCKHCSVTNFYGGEYRRKSDDYVIGGLRDIYDMGHSLFITDDNSALQPRKTTRLLEAIVREGLVQDRPDNWVASAQVSVMVAEDDQLLAALKKAKVHILYIGIESIFDDSLAELGKKWGAKQTKEAIIKLRKEGFLIHGMMMPGADTDTPERLREMSEWINNNLDTVQLFPPTPLPGSELFHTMQERILTHDYSLYDAQKVVARPVNFSPLELQLTIQEMYKSFYTKERRKRLKNNRRLAALYLPISRSILQSLSSPQYKDHLEFLRDAA